MKIKKILYIKYMGKLSWLVAGTQPDLSYAVLKMLQKGDSTTIADFHNCKKVLSGKKKFRVEFLILFFNTKLFG